MLDEEQELFDEDSQERIAEGTRLIQNAALAANNVGAIFGTMSGLVGAAFDNIKDSSQGFHLYIKSMLEDLVKRAAALVATFCRTDVDHRRISWSVKGTGCRQL